MTIEKDMAVERRAIDDLIPYARNARTHDDAQVAQIAASIREFGWTNPVLVDGGGGIIAGHGRVMAARQLGLTDVPCIPIEHLTDAQKRAYVIADNKLAINAGWDNDTLAVEFEELETAGFDIGLTGFSGDELNGIMTDDDFDPGDESDQGQLDEPDPKLVTCPHCEREFDARGKV